MGVNQKTIAFDIASRFASQYQSPPTKQVNRAFTGSRVTITAAQRIAEVLAVPLAELLDLEDQQTLEVAEAQGLWQASERRGAEQSQAGADDGQTPLPRRDGSISPASRSRGLRVDAGATGWPAFRRTPLIVAGAAVVAVIGAWYAAATKVPSAQLAERFRTAARDGTVPTASTKASARWPVLEFGAPEGPRAADITDAVEAHFADVAPVLPDGRRYATGSPPKHADGLIWVTTEAREPALIVLVAAGDGTTRRLIWTDVIAPKASEYRIRRLASDVTDTLVRIHEEGREPAIVPPEALDLYARGVEQLGKARRELTIRRAQDYFESAMRLAPAWAAAHAQLCHIKMVKYMWSRDVSALDQAAIDCERAEQLDPESVIALKSSAYLARWQGDMETAERKFERALTLDPDAVSVLGAYAEFSLDRFRRTGDSTFAAQARTLAERFVEADPDNWKGPFMLGRIAYMVGDSRKAIDWTERAAQIDPNWQVLSNLGTFHFCAGDFEAARDVYVTSMNSAPEMWVAQTNLGAVYHALGQFAEAADHFRKALELRGDEDADHHQLRGNYAQALLMAGRRQEAAEQFELALGTVERHIVSVNGGAVPRAFRAYYQAVLSSLGEGEAAPQAGDFLDRELRELEGSTTDSGALTALVFARLARNELSLARQTAAALAQSCPGYAMAPEFEMLAKQASE